MFPLPSPAFAEFRCVILLLVVFLFTGSVLLGQTGQEGEGMDRASMLEALESLRQEREQSVGGKIRGLAGKFRSAASSASSALDFLNESIMVVEFTGLNRESGQLREWREAHDALLGNEDFRSALQHYLKYMAFTLRRAAGEDLESVLPDLLEYTRSLALLEPPEIDRRSRGAFRWVEGSLLESPFAERYQLKDHLGKVKDWSMRPLDYHGIFEKTILPAFREAADSRLVVYWDERIAEEEKKAAESEKTFDIGQFESQRKPELYWMRARELKVLGRDAEAAHEMFTILKRYPTHPSFDAWAAELEKLLQGETPAQP